MNLLKKFQQVDTFIFDLEGVFAGNEIWISPSGEKSYKVNQADLDALKKAIKHQYTIIFCYQNAIPSLEKTLESIGIARFYDQSIQFPTPPAELMEDPAIEWKKTLWMTCCTWKKAKEMKMALTAVPLDAPASVKIDANYISPFKAGEGCISDVLEKVLRLNEK